MAELDPDAPWSQKLMVNHRRTLGVLIPFCFYQLCWWCLAFKHDFFALFPQRWILSVTMIFGATVAGKLKAGQVSSELLIYCSRNLSGMTSEGGGAVAFPVMTLALSIPPSVARDFSLMIQSCG